MPIPPAPSTATTPMTALAGTQAGFTPLQRDFWLNVFGGVLAAVAFALLSWFIARVLSWVQHRRFRQVFGDDVATQDLYHLIYGQYKLDECLLKLAVAGAKNAGMSDCKANKLVGFPYVRPHRPHLRLSIGNPVGGSAVPSAQYLLNAIAKHTGTAAVLTPDQGTEAKFDASFIAIGGPNSNDWTREALQLAANDGVKISPDEKNTEHEKITIDGEHSYFRLDEGGDVGLILKVHPDQFPDRTWIVCAGFTESGSKGAAWYLANRWRDIRKWARAGPFAMLVRVEADLDDSAKPIAKATLGKRHRPTLPCRTYLSP